MRWLLLSHALCFSLLKASAHIVELNNMFGQIQSPGYPDAYPSDSEVTWNITVPEGFRIKLYFMHFNLESSYLCEYDYVKPQFHRLPFPSWPIRVMMTELLTLHISSLKKSRTRRLWSRYSHIMKIPLQTNLLQSLVFKAHEHLHDSICLLGMRLQCMDSCSAQTGIGVTSG